MALRQEQSLCRRDFNKSGKHIAKCIAIFNTVHVFFYVSNLAATYIHHNGINLGLTGLTTTCNTNKNISAAIVWHKIVS